MHSMLTTEHQPVPHSRAAGERNKAEIRRLFKQGQQGRAIARELDLNESYVYRVIRALVAEAEEAKSA